MRVHHFFALFLALASFQSASWAEGSGDGTAKATCYGRSFTPSSDVCWRGMYPYSIGGRPMSSTCQKTLPTVLGQSCNCYDDPVSIYPYRPRQGTMYSWWGPRAVMEAVRTPDCFPALGGDSDGGGGGGGGGDEDDSGSSVKTGTKDAGEQEHAAFLEGHLYPTVLEAKIKVFDDRCGQEGETPYYFSEHDKGWRRDDKRLLYTPEVFLYAKIKPKKMRTLSMAECAISTLYFPSPFGVVVQGCQGSLHPLTGHIGEWTNGVAMWRKIGQRMLAWLHRKMSYTRSIPYAVNYICRRYPSPFIWPIMNKFQDVYPVAANSGCQPYCADTFGASSVAWEPGKEYPVSGEDGYGLWFEKRDCCGWK